MKSTANKRAYVCRKHLQVNARFLPQPSFFETQRSAISQTILQPPVGVLLRQRNEPQCDRTRIECLGRRRYLENPLSRLNLWFTSVELLSQTILCRGFWASGRGWEPVPAEISCICNREQQLMVWIAVCSRRVSHHQAILLSRAAGFPSRRKARHVHSAHISSGKAQADAF